MTLGKIERFWKTILNEFLLRAQFDSFETARERIALWVKYYNYKRPHQGIGSLCPADRFFEIQNDLRHTLEKGVEDNVLEQALRGKPTSPFYMVGRLGDQNVVIRAEKGKVKMHVDGNQHDQPQELVYNMDKENSNDQETDETTTQNIHITGEMQSGPVTLDGTPECNRDQSGAINQQYSAEHVAGSGDGSDAVSPGTAELGKRGNAASESSSGEAFGEKISAADTAGTFKAGETAGENPEDCEVKLQGRLDGQKEPEETADEGKSRTESQRRDLARAKWSNNRNRRRRFAGRFKKYLL
jgi:hypothetical protein